MFRIALLTVLASLVKPHMRMLQPLPRGHPNNEQFSPKDFDLVAPLAGPKTFPCAGKTSAGGSTATYQAGETITVQLEGGATHNGGHCQFGLSCSGSSNFVVIKSVLNTCPLEKSYQVPLPSGASGKCTLSWSWLNLSGNRELYMNCADITINGPGGTFQGPPLTVLNVPGHDTMPEGGAAPYDEAGVPNFRYGQKATENFATGMISSSGSSVPPPSTEGTDMTPPSTDGMDMTPPSTDGIDMTPPSTDGMDMTPPSTGGTDIVAPPSTGGTTVTPPPPSTTGNPPAPPSTGDNDMEDMDNMDEMDEVDEPDMPDVTTPPISVDPVAPPATGSDDGTAYPEPETTTTDDSMAYPAPEVAAVETPC